LAVRWYVDADTLGLAHVLIRARNDVTFPGDPGETFRGRRRPPCPIESTDVPDEEWIAEVGRRGWCVITRDREVMKRPAELAAVHEHGVRMFAVTSPGQLTTWELVEAVVTQWREMEKLVELPGPWIYGLTRSSLRRLLPVA